MLTAMRMIIATCLTVVLLNVSTAYAVEVQANDTVVFTTTRTPIAGGGLNVTAGFTPPANYEFAPVGQDPGGNPRWANANGGPGGTSPTITGGPGSISVSLTFADANDAAAYFMYASGKLKPLGGGGGGGGGPVEVTWAAQEQGAPDPVIEGDSLCKIGRTVQLKVRNGTGTPAFTWSSNHTDIATVDSSGKISGVAAGAVTITVTDSNNKTDTYEVKVVRVASVTVTDGATQTNVTGEKNWAEVKKAEEFVEIKATLEPDMAEADLPAGFVEWEGGTGVEGKQKERRVSRGASAKTKVTATVGTSSDYVTIWILWAQVTVHMTGTVGQGELADAIPFGNLYDGTEQLGSKLFDNGNHAVGKVVPVAQLTPAGVKDVVKAGWKMKRERKTHLYNNGVAKKTTADWTDTWKDDTSFANVQVLVPDASDRLYDRDAPDISSAATNDSEEIYSNFQQRVLWNANRCSEDVPWSWVGWWKSDANPKVQKRDLAGTHIQLPAQDAAHYAPPAP